MAPAAAPAAPRIVDLAFESLRVFATTGSVALAIAPVLDEVYRWYVILKENDELRFKVIFPAGVIAMLTGLALIFEDWDDFAVRIDRWHHWMLGVIVFILGIVLIALAIRYGM